MRFKLTHLMQCVLAAAIVLAIYQLMWGPPHFNARITFGAYLACLSTATVATIYARPASRGFWLGYAIFGWCWCATVLRDYLGMMPDVYASNMVANCLLGMGLSALTAMACNVLPQMRQ